MTNTRYLRHEQIEGFSQTAVASLHVLVIGAGAIGNEVVKNLALLGSGQITVYDFDRVEPHNLTRSVLLRESDIGGDKAQCVATRARELDPSITIDSVHGDIHETLSLSQVRSASIVIGCTDNFEARIRINQLCLLAARPWINTAIDARYGSVELFPFDRASDNACYECSLPDSVYARLAERQSCGGLLRAALTQQVMPTTTITTSVTAALACNEALRYLGCDTRGVTSESAPAQAEATKIFFDTIGATSNRVGIEPAELCAGCGSIPRGARIVGLAVSGADLLAIDELITGISGADRPIALSDKLVWHCACEQCGEQPETTQFIGKRAASLTDSITLCARCRQPAVNVDVRDLFTVNELAGRYRDTPIPAMWALTENGIVEFGKRAPATTTSNDS